MTVFALELVRLVWAEGRSAGAEDGGGPSLTTGAPRLMMDHTVLPLHTGKTILCEEDITDQ